MPIDYSKIPSLIMLADCKQVTYGLRILDIVVDKNPDVLPKNFEWWERIYFKSIRHEDKEVLVKLIHKGKIKNEWVYKLIHEILHSFSMYRTLIKEALLCVNWLLQSSTSESELRNTKFSLKSSGIDKELVRLYDYKDNDIKMRC